MKNGGKQETEEATLVGVKATNYNFSYCSGGYCMTTGH